MVTEEINEAEQALKVLTTMSGDVVGTLRKATGVAKAQQARMGLSSEEVLNDARHDVVIAFNDLIASIQEGVSAPDKIEIAKGAAGDWLWELKVLRV